MKRSIWDGVVLLIGLAAALAVFYAGWCLFWILVRDIDREVPERHEIVIDIASAVPEAEDAGFAEDINVPDINVGDIEIYREGEGEPPAWYQPDGPMAVEWFAATCRQVKETNQEADSGDFGENPGEAEQVKSGLEKLGEGGRNSSETGFALDTGDYLLDVPLSEDFQRYLHGLCEEAGIPFVLAVAVIEAESSYQPDVISETGDWGIMQINEICHAWLSEELGIEDYLDPYQNARAGVWLLGWHYARYGYESGTLIAYNQGQQSAEELFSRGIYATAYSERVMGIRYRLEQEAGR